MRSLTLILLLVLVAPCAEAQQTERLSGVAQTDDGRHLALRASLSAPPNQALSLVIEIHGHGRHEFSGTRTGDRLEFWGSTTKGIVGSIGPNTGQLFHGMTLTDQGLGFAGTWTTKTSSGERTAWIVLTRVPPRAQGGISAAVGPGAPNRDADVRWVQRRLRALGFSWVGIDGDFGPQLGRAIRARRALRILIATCSPFGARARTTMPAAPRPSSSSTQ